MSFRFVLASVLVQRKFTTDRCVWYINGWVVSLVLRRKVEDFFLIYEEGKTKEENRILYHKGQIF